ncbi:MAG: site-2 protease family protein [Clostridia bacterium]|nr:site-2 protease family protein [Clostridia bacterium]
MFNLDPIAILLSVPGIVIGFAFHEFAHAFMADRLGDPTPRSQGRLTLDPRSHIDLVGFIFILLVGLGWAKPVMTSPRHYRNPRRDDTLVSLAGPVMNLLIAFVFAVILKFVLVSGINFNDNFNSNLYLLIVSTIQINVLLFVLNLIPIPTFDGYHILVNLLPSRNYPFLYTLERYGTLIFIILAFTGILSYIMSGPIRFIMTAMSTILGL